MKVFFTESSLEGFSKILDDTTRHLPAMIVVPTFQDAKYYTNKFEIDADDDQIYIISWKDYMSRTWVPIYDIEYVYFHKLDEILEKTTYGAKVRTGTVKKYEGRYKMVTPNIEVAEPIDIKEAERIEEEEEE